MTAARGFIGAGDIYIDRIESGVHQGITGPYYASKFEIKPNLKKLPLISFARSNYGQVLEDASVQAPSSFTIDMAQADKISLSIGLFGTLSDISQTSGTLTAEVLTAKLDVWVPLSKDSLTGDQTVTDTTGATTYVLGTDYAVNKQMGWIRALPGGAIAADQSLKITTSYGAFSGSKIAGATKTEIRAGIIFVGINMADQSPCIIRVHEGVITADSAVDFLSDNFNAVNLPGTMVTPDGATEPYTIEFRTA